MINMRDKTRVSAPHTETREIYFIFMASDQKRTYFLQRGGFRETGADVSNTSVCVVCCSLQQEPRDLFTPSV